jgi:glycosyltransferase involved in cell wall biosynthesis
MDKKRVLIFSTAYLPLIGGAEVALKEITDRLGEGFAFDIVCSKLKNGLPSRERIGNATVHRVGFGITIDKYLLSLIGPFVGLRLFGLRGPDLLWSMQASYGGFASLFYSWIRPKTRFLLTLQEGDPFERYAKHAGPFNVLHKKIFCRADAVQVISTFLGDWALKMGFEGAPVRIPNGVDVSKFAQSEDRRAKGEDINIISASRLSHKNGIDLLIRAMALLPERVTLQLAGEGEDCAMLEELARELGVSSRVQFLGNKTHDEIAKLYQDADIFCRPSRTEGLGNSFLEAMATGLPTVGTPVGGIPDFLNKETGWLCEPENPESIADMINRILATPREEIDRVTQNAARLVREAYNWDTVARDMRALFERTIASKRILIVTGIYPPEIGGPATYVPLLSRGLVEAGDRVRVVTFGNHKTERGDGWGVSILSKSGSAPVRYFRMFLRVFNLSSGFDVIYAQTPSSDGFPASLVAKLCGIPFALKVVGDYAWEAYRNAGGSDLLDEFIETKHDGAVRVLEWMERFVAKTAKIVVVPSDYLASVVGRWGVPKEKIRRIYNAVRVIKPSRDRETLRRAFGVEEKNVLFTVVRCVPWKGVDFLIDLLPFLPENTLLVVAGDGPMRQKWEERAEAFHVLGRIKFLGSVSPHVIADWNATADAFVLASGYEGYPHVVVEAMAGGIPCFVSDKTGNKEMGALFPTAVTVLPYRDRTAWMDALNGPYKTYDRTRLHFQGREALLLETQSLLHNLCASSR